MSPTLISKDLAILQGLKRYFTGNPCDFGHLTERYVVNQRCVECAAIARKKHRADHADEVREKRSKYRESRRELDRQQERERRAKNPEKAKERVRRWRARNIEKCKENARIQWQKIRAQVMEKKKERYANDSIYAMSANVRSTVGKAFGRFGYTKRSRTSELVGCAWDELKKHIEKQFRRGMNWENRGVAWHIDHIVPLASATTPEELRALCHFTNLRPLPALENHRKSAKREFLI